MGDCGADDGIVVISESSVSVGGLDVRSSCDNGPKADPLSN